MTGPNRLEAFGVTGVGEVRAGDDVAALLLAALDGAGERLRDGDVVAVSSKVVSKAEGRVLEASGRDEAVASQTVRVVAERTAPRGVTRIVESLAGPVMAAAGVDASNVEPGRVLLLPADPDASARALRARFAAAGVRVGVLLTDTFGRPWRDGQTDVALGAAGLAVTDDLRGGQDGYGNPLLATVRALADEVAALADLVKGKLDGVPAAVVRGLEALVLPAADDGPGAAALLRTGPGDWFRYGHVEAVLAALGVPAGAAAAVEPRSLFPEPVQVRARRAVALATSGRGGGLQPHVDAEDEDGGAVTVVLSGEEFALGALTERLLAAAWSQDLAADVQRRPDRVVVLLREPPAG